MAHIVVPIGIILLCFALIFWVWVVETMDGKMMKLLLSAMLVILMVLAGTDLFTRPA